MGAARSGISERQFSIQKRDILLIPDVVLGAGEAMRRREFIVFASSTVATWPLAAQAQQPEQKRLIGVLMPYAESDSAVQSWLAAFRAALAKLGWSEGSNLRIELRWSAADPDKNRTFAKELVDLRPDAIFGVSTPAIDALAR